MKKLTLFLYLITFSFSYSQDKETFDFKKNELKGNALFLIIGAAEITYERLLNEESGVGVSLFVAYANNMDQKINLSPFYRFYFGKKPAAGFFVEGFGMLNSYSYNKYDYVVYDPYPLYTSSETITKDNRTDFALGFGLGSKWISKSGFLFEVNAGIGRNLFNSNDTNFTIVGRGGISMGYRF